MNIKLYCHKFEQFNYISEFAKTICDLYNLPITVIPSKHSWSSIGDLPVLHISSYTFTSENIFFVLKSLINLHSNLPLEAVNECQFIEDICFLKLIPAIRYLRRSAEKGIISLESLNWVIGENTSQKDSKFTEQKKAYETLDYVHCFLDQYLEGHSLFSQRYTDKYCPDSTDLLIFSCLKEELYYLNNDSLSQNILAYKNLNSFVFLVESFITEGKKFKSEDLAFNENMLKEKSFRLGHLKLLKEKDDYSSNRRGFITGVFFIFFGFLWVCQES